MLNTTSCHYDIEYLPQKCLSSINMHNLREIPILFTFTNANYVVDGHKIRKLAQFPPSRSYSYRINSFNETGVREILNFIHEKITLHEYSMNRLNNKHRLMF